MAALRIGLTGGLASGKSTVARHLEAAGFVVVDADRLVEQLYRPGEPGAQAVEALFGSGYLDSAGGVDKERLAGRVFSDGEARARLEQVIHPLVRARFADLAAQAHGVIVLEATRLVEAGYAADFDLVVTVEADAAARLARAVDRGMAADDAAARLAAQGDGARRRGASHEVIENSGDLAGLERNTHRLVERIRALMVRQA